MLKICSTCKVEKPLTEFTRSKAQKSGYMCYCKACNNLRNKAYRKEEATLEAACKRVYSYLARRCREGNKELDITPNFLEDLYRDQKGLCAYTGEPLELNAGKPNTLSVDRLDSSQGYTKSNVRLTTWVVNNCKQDLSMEDFLDLCRKVIKHGSN